VPCRFAPTARGPVRGGGEATRHKRLAD